MVSIGASRNGWEGLKTHLDDVAPGDLSDALSVDVLASAGEQGVLDLLVAHERSKVHPGEERAQEPANLLEVALLGLAQERQLRRVGELVCAEHARDRRPARDGREARLDELLRVQRAVEVLTARDRRRQEHADGVDRLEDAAQVRAPGDLFDQQRREPPRAQLLVHAEEVDLGAPLCPGKPTKSARRWRAHGEGSAHCSDANVHRDARDERNELVRGNDANTDVPVGNVPRGTKGPAVSTR